MEKVIVRDCKASQAVGSKQTIWKHYFAVVSEVVIEGEQLHQSLLCVVIV